MNNDSGDGFASIIGWPGRYILLSWMTLAGLLTFQRFFWQIDFFRQRGSPFVTAFLIMTTALVAGVWAYEKLRPRCLRFELPALLFLPLCAASVYDTRSLVVLLALLIGAYAAGSALARKLGLAGLSAAEDIAVSIGLGLGCFMEVLFALGMAGLYRRPVFAGLLLFPIVAFPSSLYRLGSTASRLQSAWTSAAPAPFPGSLFVVFALPFLFCSEAVALSPSIAFDVLRQHLPAAEFYSAFHRLQPLPLDTYSYFPQGVETLMAMLYNLAGQTAAQMISPVFFFLAALLAFSLARRCGASVPVASIATLCGASIPFLHWDGSVAKNDLPLAFFELASLYSIVRWRSARSIRWLLCAALCLAFAANVKYTVVFGALPLMLLLARSCWQSRRRLAASVLVAAVLAGLGLLWPARAYILTGNPIMPVTPERAVRMQGAPRRWPTFAERAATFIETPWRMQFGPRTLFASPLRTPMGIALALFGPALFFARRPNRAWRQCLFFASVYFLIWAAVWPVPRFGVASILLFTVLGVSGLGGIFADAPRWMSAVVNGALAYCLIFALSGVMILEVNAPQIAYFAGRIDRDGYLRRTLATYPSLVALRRVSAPDDLTLGVGNCSTAYAPFPWRYTCLERDAPIPQIQRALAQHRFRFLMLPSTDARSDLLQALDPARVFAVEYGDANFTLYRIAAEGGASPR